MDAEGYRSAPAMVQDDRGVSDGYYSGNQHQPTKRACGSVSYGNRREQARRNVSNTFREQIRPRIRLGACWYAVPRGRQSRCQEKEAADKNDPSCDHTGQIEADACRHMSSPPRIVLLVQCWLSRQPHVKPSRRPKLFGVSRLFLSDGSLVRNWWQSDLVILPCTSDTHRAPVQIQKK
jgi:hypothetical protein